MSSSGHSSATDSGHPNSWAIGLQTFAGVMMLTIGVFQVMAGLVALVDDKFYVVGANYTFEFDTTTWGWIHLCLGIALALVGFGVLSGATWARVVGIIFVILSMMENFLFIPYYPVWSVLIIGLNVAVIWALSFAYTPVGRAR